VTAKKSRKITKPPEKPVSVEVTEKSRVISHWLIPCLIGITTFVVFLPVLQNGFINLDDQHNLLENPKYRGLGWSNLTWMFTTFHNSLYRPLTWITWGSTMRFGE
jgi:hypothetical protein